MLPEELAKFDQNTEELTEILVTYFNSLISKGMTREEALMMTMAIQSDCMKNKKENES